MTTRTIDPSASRSRSAETRVRLVEVGPRDGLQNEAKTVQLSDKLMLIEKLIDAGVTCLEAGSFVSARWVPQMADSEAVCRTLGRRRGVSMSYLVPNLRGLQTALAAQAGEVAIFAATTESFSKANLNASRDESFARFTEVAGSALLKGIRVRGYISCAVHCPYEGWVDTKIVAELAERLLGIGCYEVSLCDTTGAASPARATAMIEAVRRSIPLGRIAVHYHDTYGQALANTLVSLELGVTTIDSAVAGLGGCPYSPGAAGNLATEDLVHMLNGLGINTGIDIARLVEASEFISQVLGKAPQSRVSVAMQGSKFARCAKSQKEKLETVS